MCSASSKTACRMIPMQRKLKVLIYPSRSRQKRCRRTVVGFQECWNSSPTSSTRRKAADGASLTCVWTSTGDNGQTCIRYAICWSVWGLLPDNFHFPCHGTYGISFPEECRMSLSTAIPNDTPDTEKAGRREREKRKLPLRTGLTD